MDSYEIKWARGPNGQYLVDSDGNNIPCMYDIVSYYFNVIYLGYMVCGKRIKKEGK